MIAFRSIDEKDLPLLKSWRNSQEVYQYTREYRLLTDDDQLRWYKTYLSQRRHSEFDTELYILVDDKRDIGAGGFTRVEWRNRKAELSFYLSQDCQGERRIKECLHALIKLGFETFNLHKICWPVYEHDPKLPIYKQVFAGEAVLKEEYFWAGKYQDRLYLSVIKKNVYK